MTDVTFTSKPQNYSIANFTQECVKQVEPCIPLTVPPRTCEKNPRKHDAKNGQDFAKMIEEMFAERTLPRKKVIKYEHGVKNEAVEEELTAKPFAFNIFFSLSTSCQSIGKKLKKALTPKKKESAAEKRANALQLKLNHLLDLEAVTLNEYVPDALYDELARLDAIIAQEKGL